MGKKKRSKIIYVVINVALFFVSYILFANPKFTVVCDDFIGGRLPPGSVRGYQCRCSGWKFYLKHDSPADGHDLSICIGVIKEIRLIN